MSVTAEFGPEHDSDAVVHCATTQIPIAVEVRALVNGASVPRLLHRSLLLVIP